ncbi:FO synthase subunit 1 [Microcystis aeruginosa PCC 9432]|uniref:7,8-didemethyl-8-hydroxy-5-deazariboflavin synthase n=1 Tax=Microcystis aeruginosa PCC 9432 TaxID=1160280 RepID=A0A822LEU4_MICAE|nr:7,8-didemethyl-8-hydroxy-5-deazariboflavin synthase subunit CofG [Microcystis aeruginosa]TRT91867.1 MAG: 7,8-didemethyl-8-hydroxy-5-deazariboflavin synthase subunit CofG [Microcystis aeruginosa Ma_OC_LR_19540900_S633]CCH93395.1 FO synthase subunit 1 [Microcystis aeruginosa PCC 9432]
MSRIVTYSPSHTLVPTYECFNRCSYCNFRRDLGTDGWLSLEKAKEILTALQGSEITEILILSGEVHPLAANRELWFRHIYNLGELALNMGFYPHTNAGILTFAEMEKLKNVNLSMGIMLEQMTVTLLNTVHRHAPSKVPSLRLEQLQWAGELAIPFTTGLLLGIGETECDRLVTLETIATIHQRWGHIQEVILQPYNPGKREQWQNNPFDLQKLPDLVRQAREILPPDIVIQIPPNLVPDPLFLLDCLASGARDLGGIGIIDEVNPDYLHLHPDKLKEFLAVYGWELKPRLPVYQ